MTFWTLPQATLDHIAELESKLAAAELAYTRLGEFYEAQKQQLAAAEARAEAAEAKLDDMEAEREELEKALKFATEDLFEAKEELKEKNRG